MPASRSVPTTAPKPQAPAAPVPPAKPTITLGVRKGGQMIEVMCNDRLGKKVRVKCK